ncbi:lasso RiPP family leader peptide-containing protein [Saccharopolyspora sp. CA-218241]
MNDYIAPALAEVGEFSEDTLGWGNTYWDNATEQI